MLLNVHSCLTLDYCSVCRRETNASHADAILKAIGNLFQTYPFAYEDGYARVISGAEEGVFGWITVNYLLGTVDPDRVSQLILFSVGRSEPCLIRKLCPLMAHQSRCLRVVCQM